MTSFVVCKSCNSLFSPNQKVCPVCEKKVKTRTKCRVFRVSPYAVCSNCGSLLTDIIASCPICEATMDSCTKREIVEQPVELEIIGIAEETIGQNRSVFG